MTTEKLKIAIVDDEEHIRDFLGEIIEHFGYEIAGKASNGFEALDLFRKEVPDIMLLDINMPKMTGDKVLKELLQEFPDAFIIMLTAISEAETVKRCISLGASYFVLKETPVAKMIETIKEAIKKYEEKRRISYGKFNLNKMLKEIQEDKILCVSANREMSQDEIKEFLFKEQGSKNI
ncbi:MAG: response regulator transcription factor [Candidatus Gastranaerophilales bacterium]|nr:response regulator transcription factor [Candidatus Gastranaerophilales bacterium]